ncbi:hypothetical protein THMIRHAS_12170 [Thiosulfatimonas sediminis]|uniref:Sel1 repeat family protein n=1 Tax=Thiosulfatimonas sediminis TaxID=2675054 RepID=A0A6F8PV05_9GAMM|nr:tetratricopeptide repeat protein [Thiosulfatimonas sediminis]BBP45844.1 hypothetical protein THMIRHAS_12170 [Thiosulfatimonas sediminis]
MNSLSQVFFTSSRQPHKRAQRLTQSVLAACITFAGSNAYAFNQNACLQTFQGEALEVCKAAIQGNPQARYQLARVYGDAVNSNMVDYEQSFFWHRELSRQVLNENLQDPVYSLALYNTGVMYSDGVGVQQNVKNAVFWFEKAAQRGEPLAMTRLAMIYQSGAPQVKADFKQAQNWLEKAVAKDNAQAKVIMSKWILEGKINKPEIQAIDLLKASAIQKSPQGSFALGNMYATGYKTVIKQDLIEAKKLYSIACSQYMLDACKRYHDIDTTGKILP